MRTTDINIPKYYYYVKPLIPRRLQIQLRRWSAARKRRLCSDIWPIDRQAGKSPDGWAGWPDNKRFALVLTHDVDTFKGHEQCRRLMRLEEEMGFKSSYNFVIAEYDVCRDLRRYLAEHGFEVGIHGLVHNRKMYESKTTFLKHAAQINHYLREWKAVGFRSPCMYHNLEWLSELDVTYDASTFDTDPFEPQPDGVGTIFPFYVRGSRGQAGYTELPYTLPQDFSLFILFRERDITIWKEKLDWIAESGGMVLLNTHPDYMSFGNGKKGYEEYPAQLYQEFLTYVRERYEGTYWHALPREMANFWGLHQQQTGV